MRLAHIAVVTADLEKARVLYEALGFSAERVHEVEEQYHYDTPREFPEYTRGYCAVFFEDPDRLKLEIAYVPDVRASAG